MRSPIVRRTKTPKRLRGEAGEGMGYGTQRRRLQEKARDQIERSIEMCFFCEAIAIIDSIITDRLESRLSWLKRENSGFRTLGGFRELKQIETDKVLRDILYHVESWAPRRNAALHEMVKVERESPERGWEERLVETERTARDGYEIAKHLYHRVADLNLRHLDRVFPQPKGALPWRPDVG
jgi:hypothetical protein